MNLAQELALLAYGDDGKPVSEGLNLDSGLGGALLVDLALAGRIDVEDGKVVVLDGGSTGDPLLDGALARIAGSDKPRKAGHWVTVLSVGARDKVLQSLVAAGVVRTERDRVMWVFPRTRYPAADGVEPAPETRARERMRTVLTTSGAVEPRTAALCTLVAATGLDRNAFAELEPRQVKARLTEIGEGAWAADAVRRAIEEIEAAVMVAVMVAVTAAT